MYGFAGRLARYFIDSKLTPIMIMVLIVLGFWAVVTTPKEEDPDIVVPMIDIMIPYPGATPREVEKRIVTPLEKKLWELKDIEYIYSASGDGYGMVTARFYVGTDPIKALVELNSKMMASLNLVPPGVQLPPLVRLMSIDDVPIMTLTLWGKGYDYYSLRRIADAIDNELKTVPNVASVEIYGGQPRELRVLLDPAKMAAYHISPGYIVKIIQEANSELPSGHIQQNNTLYYVKTGEFIRNKRDLENIVVGFFNNKPVYLRDVAKIEDGPGSIKDYVTMGFGPASKEPLSVKDNTYPAVTISIAKRPGTNAVEVANQVIKKINSLKGVLIPDSLHVSITRNYGKSADEKSNELIEHLFIATISVVLLIAVTLGIREAAIVAVAVPVTLAFALFFSKLYGFTLNRVTLFALIFSIGILVDAAIVVVENIHRWFEYFPNIPKSEAIIRATDEVGNPNILATFTIISALMPMAFVGGLMGPYMRPIPINASAAILFSLWVAFTITPWLAYRLIKKEEHNGEKESINIKSTTFWKLYCKVVEPLLISKFKRVLFYIAVWSLLLLSVSMLVFKLVIVKMLPYDNKSELSIVLNMPENTTLEDTYYVARKIASYIAKQKEVKDYQIYAGFPEPFDFNGLVRHYYLRERPYYAQIAIELVNKNKREEQSHDFAKRIRPMVQKIAYSLGATYVGVEEPPPGPPVLSSIEAEIFAPNLKEQREFAKKVLEIFRKSPYVTDSGIYLETKAPEVKFVVDQAKAAQYGISKDNIVKTLRIATAGYDAGIIYSTDTEKVPIVVRLASKYRTLQDLESLKVQNDKGQLIPLSELVKVVNTHIHRTIYHENLRRVIYVIGEPAGREEAPFYSILHLDKKIEKIPNPYGKVHILWMSYPSIINHVYVKWDGEMQITLEVFRDLGIAFAGALFIIYTLIVGWFKDFKIPGIIMSPIPLTLVGIIPGHFILHAFFTATSMIGFIALAGIILRNSILLVEFAEQRQKEGVPLHLAVVEAGVIRTRPVLLTAAALIVGAFVIIFDPIFNGLAISLIFGTIGSTTLTLVLIPLMYYGSRLKGKLPSECPTPEEISRDLRSEA